MAENRKRRPEDPRQAQSQSRPRPSAQKRAAPARRPRRRKKQSFLQVLADRITRYRAEKSEFRPDSQESTFLKSLHFTQQQRMHLLRWVLLSLTCILCLVIQDCVLSRARLFGATTDLGVAAILLVTIMEGSEVGGIFALLASVVYHYSGSAPGPYCVVLITIPGILCALFRQKFWRRGTTSNLLCSFIAMFIYEIGLFLTALFMGLTRLDRFQYFVLTALYSTIVMIPLYQLIYRIGKMGGHVWKD